MWKYDEPFYGKWLKVLICGYIRPEKNYDSLRKFKLFSKFAFLQAIQRSTQKIASEFEHMNESPFLPLFKDVIIVNLEFKISVNCKFLDDE